MINNGTQNSRIEISLGVVRNLLDDIATLIEGCETLRELCRAFNIRREIDRDYRYIESRVHHEGFAFLTTTLPTLGKWYDDLLAERPGPTPEGFKPLAKLPRFRHSADEANVETVDCPVFLRIFWYVIHGADGSVPERAVVIRAYRSLLYLFYKYEVPFSESQLKAGLEKWKSIEEEIADFDYPSYFDRDIMEARHLVTSLVNRAAFVLFGNERTKMEDLFKRIRPKHGPGAVACGEQGDEKWEKFHLIPSLHNVYPWYDLLGVASSCRMSPSALHTLITFVKGRSVRDAVSRLCFVPKDSRGPRMISCEPKELMFVQQGIARNLMESLPILTRGRINFLEQPINQDLAQRASAQQDFATVDLEDASDRVSWKLIRILFPDWTHRFLQATRSHSTLLPDGTVFKDHAKYAPMGSALCFPIESVVFWVLGVRAAVNAGHTLESARRDTYVYGDDIIIKPEVVPYFKELLARVSLKVNTRKTYESGPFRESCGVDAWKGQNVTPLKIKKDICRRSLDGALASACCDYSSACFARDYRKTGEYLYQHVEEQYPGIPRTTGSPIGCLHVRDRDPSGKIKFRPIRSGYNRGMQKRWIEGWVVTNPLQPSSLTGLSRLLKNLMGDWEFYDPGEVVVPRATKIRKRKILVEGWPIWEKSQIG